MSVKAILAMPIFVNGTTLEPTIAAGPGAPKTNTINGANNASAGTPVVGSEYINTTGTAGARIYWYYSGAWVAQSTP